MKVYSIGDFSREICGGPHVEHTGELGHFRIVKEEAVGAGVRRIRAVLDPADEKCNMIPLSAQLKPGLYVKPAGWGFSSAPARIDIGMNEIAG